MRQKEALILAFAIVAALLGVGFAQFEQAPAATGYYSEPGH